MQLAKCAKLTQVQAEFSLKVYLRSKDISEICVKKPEGLIKLVGKFHESIILSEDSGSKSYALLSLVVTAHSELVLLQSLNNLNFMNHKP